MSEQDYINVKALGTINKIMRKVRIVNTEGMFARDQTDDFNKFNLKIGDEIEVRNFVNYAVWYQPTPKGEVLFIYTWNIEDV